MHHFLMDSSDVPSLRLASYNIRKAVGLDWRRDPLRSLRVIGRMGADVVALQEADKRLGPRHAALNPALIEREMDLRLVPLALSPVSLGWHGNAILVRDGIEVLGHDHIALPGIEPRGAVVVHLGTPAGDLTVVGVHLGLRRNCRILQFAAILRALKPEVLQRTVIMGDFNEWSDTRGVDGLTGNFDVIRPGRSFHASRPVACLDRFALGPAVTLMKAGVERRGEALQASDHLPVWAEIRLVPRTAAAQALP